MAERTLLRGDLVVTTDDHQQPIITEISQLHPKVRKVTVRGHRPDQGFTRKAHQVRAATTEEMARFFEKTTSLHTAVFLTDTCVDENNVIDLVLDEVGNFVRADDETL